MKKTLIVLTLVFFISYTVAGLLVTIPKVFNNIFYAIITISSIYFGVFYTDIGEGLKSKFSENKKNYDAKKQNNNIK